MRKKKSKKEKKGLNIQNYKENAIEEAINRKKEYESSKKTELKLIYERYKKKPQTSRCDRISVVSEAIYQGEQVPFYNTYVPEGVELDKNKLFFPKKDYTWKRAPAWKYPKNININTDQRKARLDLEKERYDKIMDDKGLTKKDLWILIQDAFDKVTKHGKLKMKFQPLYKFKEEEQYQTYLENNPRKYVGPQHYWKMPKS